MTATACPSCGDSGLPCMNERHNPKPRQPDTKAREPSETAKVLATSVWSAYYIDAPAFETDRELFKHAFECGHARASEEMGAEVAKLKDLLHDFESCNLHRGIENEHSTLRS